MAVDWTKLDLLAPGVSWTDEFGGEERRASYYMLRSNIAYVPQRGDTVSTDFPTGWKVDRVEVEGLSAYQVLVHVTARARIQVGATFSSDLRNRWDVGYSTEDFLVTADVLNIRRLRFRERLYSDPGTPRGNRFLDPTGTIAPKAMDFIQKGTQKEIVVSRDADGLPQTYGAVVASQNTTMPILATAWESTSSRSPDNPFETQIHWKYLDRKFRMDVCTITFYDSGLRYDYWLGWDGVNNGLASSIPRKYGRKIYHHNVAKKWRAVSQVLSEVYDKTGMVFLQINRVVQHTPAGLRDINGARVLWDDDRNGGFMDWKNI